MSEHSGKAGYWWVVNLAPRQPVTAFWTGGFIERLGLPAVGDLSKAAQYPTQEEAEYAARDKLHFGEWAAEQHGFL